MVTFIQLLVQVSLVVSPRLTSGQTFDIVYDHEETSDAFVAWIYGAGTNDKNNQKYVTQDPV